MTDQPLTQDRRAPELAKLRVRYQPTENMPARESLWAEPVEADHGGGSYRLQNSSFVVPLAAGDVVRAERAGDGELQVTGLVSASGSVLTVVGAPPGADLRRSSRRGRRAARCGPRRGVACW